MVGFTTYGAAASSDTDGSTSQSGGGYGTRVVSRGTPDSAPLRSSVCTDANVLRIGSTSPKCRAHAPVVKPLWGSMYKSATVGGRGASNGGVCGGG